jgi:hypothetical protein
MTNKNNLLFIIYCAIILALAGVLFTAVVTHAFGLVLLTSLFEQEFNQATAESGFNFILVEHEDLNISLYAYNNQTTTIDENGYPQKMIEIKGYPNVESLHGANGGRHS